MQYVLSLRFVVDCYSSILPICFSVTSLAFGRSYDGADDATLKNMGKYITRIHKSYRYNQNKTTQRNNKGYFNFSDTIMSAMASQITGVPMLCSSVCSGIRSKKTSKFRVTGLCEGNSPVIPSQRAVNAENVSI